MMEKLISLLLSMILMKTVAEGRVDRSRRLVDTLETTRANVAHKLITKKLNESDGCEQLLGRKDCQTLKDKSRHELRLYMASKDLEPLNVVSVSYFRPEYKGVASVLVIDPLPQYHYGHHMVLLLVYSVKSRTECEQVKKGTHFDNGAQSECMVLPEIKKCMMLKKLYGLKESCSLQLLPRVFEIGKLKDRLTCMSELEGFAPCPKTQVTPTRLNNGEQTRPFPERKCSHSCDHAVMIYGGWNERMRTTRHVNNMREMFGHLTKRGYPTSNIDVFFANNSTMTLTADDKSQKPTRVRPADESRTIVNRVNDICQTNSKCIDTLFIYLNGPTLRDGGDLLLWDKNGDGRKSDSGVLKITDLLRPLEKCTAKNYIIVADQNYAGHIVEAVKRGRKVGQSQKYKYMAVLTSTDKVTHSYKRELTKKFIAFDDVTRDKDARGNARPLSKIAEELQAKRKSKITYLPSINHRLSIIGDYTSQAGCSNERRLRNIKWAVELK